MIRYARYAFVMLMMALLVACLDTDDGGPYTGPDGSGSLTEADGGTPDATEIDYGYYPGVDGGGETGPDVDAGSCSEDAFETVCIDCACECGDPENHDWIPYGGCFGPCDEIPDEVLNCSLDCSTLCDF